MRDFHRGVRYKWYCMEVQAMRKISAADLLELSIPERIQLVEDIWDSIAAQADTLELSAEEKDLIDQRLEAYHKNPGAGSQWEDVVKRIVNKS